jgi:hypothetical protein
MDSEQLQPVNGNCEKIVENHEEKFRFNYDDDHMDGKSEDFEVNFEGHDACTDDDERDMDDGER